MRVLVELLMRVPLILLQTKHYSFHHTRWDFLSRFDAMWGGEGGKFCIIVIRALWSLQFAYIRIIYNNLTHIYLSSSFCLSIYVYQSVSVLFSFLCRSIRARKKLSLVFSRNVIRSTVNFVKNNLGREEGERGRVAEGGKLVYEWDLEITR